jgi:transcriptional regulator with XRE-family HTH domain
MSFAALRLTGEQIRAARALARIEQTELAGRSRLSLETIKRLERIRGVVEANSRTLDAILAAFEALGVRFDTCEDGGVGVCRLPAVAAARPKSRPRAARGAAQSERPMPGAGLHRLIYSSHVKPDLAPRFKEVLDDIVGVASARNPELGVTGTLFVCNGFFLQALEGMKDAIYQVYGAISIDPRHSDIRVIESRSVSSRLFSDWTMCCGMFRSDDSFLAHEPALKDGFRPELLTAASALGLLSIVRDLQQLPPRNARGEAGDCPLAGECLDHICATTAVGACQPAL